MGLIEYVVQRDKFQADEVINVFDFPCGVCIHRHGTDMDEPCRTCDHNLRAVPEEDDGKTPMARLYGCCADEVPNAKVTSRPSSGD